MVMGLDHTSAMEEIARHRGLFIGLEGIRGADKTTAVGHVVEALGSRSTVSCADGPAADSPCRYASAMAVS